jgi:hypothetical protein
MLTAETITKIITTFRNFHSDTMGFQNHAVAIFIQSNYQNRGELT